VQHCGRSLIGLIQVRHNYYPMAERPPILSLTVKPGEFEGHSNDYC
jgi:hypothetical protein